ncbi:MAG: tRNA (guanosine(46)-N7)-methyltransferase TrmB [Lentisphaerae bacterium]|jgi:tRNA (guanine-N7-)-methyltransferase|nr:tRNA (guanosine(46)-N7)-methyltransferase TrmB [Lentisphaerota bacterium]
MLHIITNTYTVLQPLFGRPPMPTELDMGCGKGRFALDLAERFPDRLILGADVMLGRLRKVAKKADRRGLENVELLRANNLELVGYQIPDRSISRAHLLCPDPWPKDKHRNKRLATTDFFSRIARILTPGGVFHFATDHVPYFEAMQRIAEMHPAFERADDGLDDIAGIKTDFELQWEAQGKRVPHAAYRTAAGGARL